MSEQATSASTGSVNQQGLCSHCGYRLTGLPPTGLCPECGTRYERAASEGEERDERRRRLEKIDRFVAPIILGLLGLGIIAMFLLYGFLPG